MGEGLHSLSFFSLSLSLDGKSIGYRRKSSGNPGERVVATRKRRNEVLSRCSGSRPTLRFFERVLRLRVREYRISRIQDYIFIRLSPFLSFSLIDEILRHGSASANLFCCPGQIEISVDYSIVT